MVSSWHNQIRNELQNYYMAKRGMILGTIVFLIILTTLTVGYLPAQAFNKHGPIPIPGNLFPHPGTSPGNHVLKNNDVVISSQHTVR